MKKILLVLILLGTMGAATPAAARAKIVWDRTGGPVWSQRSGPGIGGVLGINQCLREYCDHHWDTVPSIALTGMFIYRFMPNFAIFVDAHIGHLGARLDPRFYEHDGGVLFGATGGGEFHLPIGTWLDPYVGFGMGYSFLGLFGKYKDVNSNPDYSMRLHGLNLEMRTGIDFFFVKKAPTFSLGPQFRIGFPVWLKACWGDGPADQCTDPDNLYDNRDPRYRLGFHDHESPYLFHFGVAAKYGF